MTPPDPRIEAIFHEALERPPKHRDAFVAEACGGDDSLTRQVQRFLAAHELAESEFKPLDSPEIEAELARLKPEEEGERIGPYKLMEKIGEGGFGSVWIAEQKVPVRRRVALKILKLGMDTKEVLARFEQERQALALMNHPSIAKVFDAGATQYGRPFIVMEMIDGVKITEYCDAQHLAMRERLELFMAVCQAVQHAHQKGVIHRDLKPSNILVTLQDGLPVPKIIDFGVAKAMQQRLTDVTVYTQIEQMIGTPPYMSPEQAEASGLNVDTRTDIYALGVLLYELLTGRPPFDSAALLKASYDEMRRLIRDQEPPKPSTALYTMAPNVLIEVARHRQSEPPTLIHAVRGDLDWIVMKALEKERARRYETANGFALDVQRHLNCEPVVARPPSGMYRFGRFVRRNRLVFAAGGTAAMAIVIGEAISIVSMIVNEKKARGAVEGQYAVRNAERRQIEQSRHELAATFQIAIQILREKADGHGRRGEWSEALAEKVRLVKLDPGKHYDWYQLAPLFVQTNDLEGYRNHRRKMLEIFAATTDLPTMERIAKASLILPVEGADLEIAGNLTNTAVNRGKTHPFLPYFQFAKGLVEYRRGRFDEAMAMQKIVIAAPGVRERKFQAFAVLAMAHHGLGQKTEAMAALSKCSELAATYPSERGGNYGENWHDVLIGQLLLREAQALIGEK